MVLLYINMNPPEVYTCSPSWTPLPPPSPYHPSGSSRCTSPKHQYHASNLDWQFVSYMILYMFQCHFPKSSHPLPLPQSPKDCSIILCLFCFLTYRVSITIFLNSIYIHEYTVLVFFFLAYFTLYNWLQFHPPHYNWFKCILFNGWVILHCVYALYHSFLIHSSADGHLGCFHVLAIINSAEMNIGVHVSLSILVSFVRMPSSGIAGS